MTCGRCGLRRRIVPGRRNCVCVPEELPIPDASPMTFKTTSRHEYGMVIAKLYSSLYEMAELEEGSFRARLGAWSSPAEAAEFLRAHRPLVHAREALKVASKHVTLCGFCGGRDPRYTPPERFCFNAQPCAWHPRCTGCSTGKPAGHYGACV